MVFFMRYIAIILCIIFFVKPVDASSYENEQLKDLLELGEEMDLTLSSWTVTHKETLPINQSAKAEKIMLEQENILVKEQSDATIYEFNENIFNPNFKISYKVISPKNPYSSSTLIVTIVSDEKNKQDIMTYSKVLNRKIVKLFSNKANKYACITFKSNDIMKKINFKNIIAETLSLHHIEQYKDTLRKDINVTEIYGYNKNWREYMMVHNKRLNLHAVIIEKPSDQIEIVIGTPIIIHEY